VYPFAIHTVLLQGVLMAHIVAGRTRGGSG
jgi:hypothetical protein